MTEIQLNLDFQDNCIPEKKSRLSREAVRKRNSSKRKDQKRNYEKWKRINNIKSASNKNKQDTELKTTKEQTTSQKNHDSAKPDLKRKLEKNQTENESGKHKRQKKTENSNYIKSNFKGNFHTIQALADNMFNDEVDIPDLPDQRKMVREELFKKDAVFEDLNLHSYLNGNLKAIFGYEKPTSVQMKSIPTIVSKKDVLIRSQTGSGKTLAYMLPIFDQLMKKEPAVTRNDGVSALVVLPTRELVLQSYNTAIKLTRAATNIVACAITGGESRKSEKARLRKGANIILGTPGRLIDHLEKSESLKNLDRLEFVVLDEADRMLEMGYLEKIKQIFTLLKERNNDQHVQNILLSATLGESIENLAGLTLHNPERILLNNEDDSIHEKFAVPSSLTMNVVVIPPKLRLVLLVASILRTTKCLVFVNTMAEVNFLHEVFRHIDLPGGQQRQFFRLHGDMEQAERVDNLTTFLDAEKSVMICTDVASRGLDLPDVEMIIQYSPPGSARDYIQRIGRTARKGHAGDSLLFLLPSETGFLSAVVAIGAGEWVRLELDDVIWQEFGGSSKATMQQARENAAMYQYSLENFIADNSTIKNLAIEGYCSFIRSYSAYPTELKPIFHVKKLHLGHLAKSFGIREKPTDFLKTRDDLRWTLRREDAGAVVDTETKKKQAERKTKRQKEVKKKINALIISEFDAGI